MNSQRLRIKVLRKKHRQRVISLMTLLAFVACLFPIALPSTQPKSSGTPFPCQDSSCGCHTPEQCWTSCCCLKPNQRAEWAKEKGITPPTYAVLSEPKLTVSSELTVPSKLTVHKSQPEPQDCCKSAGENTLPQAPAANCCPPKSPHRCETCQENHSQPDREDVSTDQDSNGSKPSKFVLIMLAFKCKGITFGYSMLPVFELTATVTLPCPTSRSESIALANATPVRIFAPVPIPPPKL